MKITVKNFRSGLSGLVVLAGLGMAGCAPIPQAYPVMQMPPAAPLLPKQQAQRAAPAQRYAARPVGRTQVRKPARPAVPPTLRPAQQANKAVNQSRQRPITRQSQRPAPAVAYRPPVNQNTRKKTSAPRPAKKQSPAAVVNKKIIKRPVTPPIKPAWETITPSPVSKPASVQNRTAAVEVLDMSRDNKKPAAKPVVEKAVPPVSSYKNNPAVTILTKQANNQLMAGKTDRAASTLERALRIAPDDPMLWLRLAEVNEQQGNKAQAASMAKKAVGLAPDDANIKQRGSRLIN